MLCNISQHRNIIKSIVDKRPEIRNKLFSFGFLFTDNLSIENEKYPFYGEWNADNIDGYVILCHKKTNYKKIQINGDVAILIGHMYNPFTMQYDENDIITELLGLYVENLPEFYDKLNQISGIFSLIILHNEDVFVVGDATGIQTNFYSEIVGNLYISTHQNLIGDLCDLKEDEYINRLINYKRFRLFGNCLPGDLSSFSEVKRLIPNHFLKYADGSFEVKRFFVIKDLQKDEGYIVDKCAEILSNSMELVSKKWDNCAISMTGGCDSKTTVSSAYRDHDKFKYFSYISNESEKADAIAAYKISKELGLDHKIYEISDKNEDFENYADYKEILFWNGGGILHNNENDIRKRCFFDKVNDFDAEVKSWCSEIGRAYYSKRFANKRSFGKKATPRKCTTLYKVFFENRKLARDTDLVFKKYIEKYGDCDNSIPWQEKFFWEFRVGAWNGVTITGEHRFSFDIVIPYNNRILLNLLLSASLDSRINDSIYKQIRIKLLEKIETCGVNVVNIKHTQTRARVENLYYNIHSRIPF